MSLFLEELEIPDYEKVIKVTDESVGLSAIIAIHNTHIGPALGGTRIYPYEKFDDALFDVLRLSKGMTYKSAVSEMGLGGGKSVIIADPKKKTKELLRSFGDAVETLKGRYICAEDVGCNEEDVKTIRESTKFVTGLKHEKSSGNPAPFTAWGTYRGIEAVLQSIYGSPSVQNRVIAIQGLGSVGEVLAELLFWNGAQLILTDINQEKAAKLGKKFGAQVVPPDQILSVKCDVLSPCALGGGINANTIPHLHCKAIAGCANNQLLEDQDANRLAQAGILYAPDFVINAGGLINVRHELFPLGYQPKDARNDVHKIYDRLLDIFEIAKQNKCSTHHAAMLIAEHRIKYKVGSEETTMHFHH